MRASSSVDRPGAAVRVAIASPLTNMCSDLLTRPVRQIPCDALARTRRSGVATRPRAVHAEVVALRVEDLGEDQSVGGGGRRHDDGTAAVGDPLARRLDVV